MEIVRAQSVSKSFGDVRALRCVTFAIEEGECVFLNGGNGSGKSTLLSCLCGLLRPDSGEILVAGQKPWSKNWDSSFYGVVSQESQLYGELSVEENLHLAAELYGLSRSTARVRESLERFHLAAIRKRLVGQCSPGMVKKTAIARAFLHEPRLLFLDEPFTSLDAPGREMLLDVLFQAQAAGVTLFVVHHEHEIIEDLTSRVLFLEDGRLLDDEFLLPENS